MQAIKSKNKLIVWIAHSEELCEQAFETIFNLWSEKGDSKLRVVDIIDIVAKQVVVAKYIGDYEIINKISDAIDKNIFFFKFLTGCSSRR
jgi:hypothetical protein